jgi:hypothetical protein
MRCFTINNIRYQIGSYSYEPHQESGDPIESRQTKITGCASPDMHYSGDGWSEQSNPLYYRGKIKKCGSPGNSVEFSFRGTDIYWRAIAASDGGKADVCIDGQWQKTVDLYFAGTSLIFQFTFIKTGFDPTSNRWSNPLNCAVGNNYQAPAMNCDADRKWVAPHDGTVRVEGTALIDGTDGAGFGASILKNADTIWSAQLTSSGKTAPSHDQVLTVHAGDSISFVVHKPELPKGQPASGASNAKIVWDPVVTYAAP